MTVRIEHPQGLSPPPEWIKTGRAPAGEFREWMQGTSQPQKRSKFGAKAGYYEDLGLKLKSLLEAKVLRYLLFVGFTRWEQKGVAPPETGKWVCYEWRSYNLPVVKGKAKGTVIQYLPDFFCWTDGHFEVLEAKGQMNQRSKQRINLWPVHHPGIPLEVITEAIIEEKAAEALYAARGRGLTIPEIPHWNQGPKPKDGA